MNRLFDDFPKNPLFALKHTMNYDKLLSDIDKYLSTRFVHPNKFENEFHQFMICTMIRPLFIFHIQFDIFSCTVYLAFARQLCVFISFKLIRLHMACALLRLVFIIFRTVCCCFSVFLSLIKIKTTNTQM